jgi:hypothetical protein
MSEVVSHGRASLGWITALSAVLAAVLLAPLAASATPDSQVGEEKEKKDGAGYYLTALAGGS